MRIDHKLAGEFEIVVHNEGKLRFVTPLQSNLILNRFYDEWLAGNSTSETLTSRCRFGSESTTVTPSTTTITQVGSASATGTNDDTITKLSNTQFKHRRVFNFAVNAVLGTCNCIALSDTIGPGTPVNIKAVLSSPVTFISGDIITVNYFMTTTIANPAVDITGTLVLDSVSYSYTLRRLAYDPTLQITAPAAYKSYFIFTGYYTNPSQNFGLSYVSSWSTQILNAFSADSNQLNLTTGDHYAQSLVNTKAAYTPGTLYRDMEMKLDVNTGNGISGGIGCLWFHNNILGEAPQTGLQISFSPKIPKTNLQELKFNLRFAFGP